jgi:hypothetical protein
MDDNLVDFGSGFVNSTRCPTNATLYAGQTYNDSEGIDCWSDNLASPTSMILINEGNTNVSVTVRGPSEQSFFNNYSGIDPYNLTWRVRESEAGSCSDGLQSNYQAFGGISKVVCSDLLFFSSNNEIAIDIRLTIPSHNLTAGSYDNSSIVFTAVGS